MTHDLGKARSRRANRARRGPLTACHEGARLSSSPPLGPKIAALALALAAGLTALGGLGSASVVATSAFLDPMLGGDWSLGISVGLLMFAIWMIAVLASAGSGFGVWMGAPAARVSATFISIALLCSPFFLVGVVVLYGLWGDPESGRWFSESSVVDPATGLEPDPVEGIDPPQGEVGQGGGGEPADDGDHGAQPAGVAGPDEELAEPQREQVEGRDADA